MISSKTETFELIEKIKVITIITYRCKSTLQIYFFMKMSLSIKNRSNIM
jgi:hypothetical protein